jgi:biotin carboxylase
MKKILFLGGSSSQIFAYEEAKKMGYITICADYLSSSPGHAIADKSFLISTTDKNKILNLSKKLKVDTIIPYASDPAAVTSSYVLEKLKLKSNPYYSVKILTNKIKFRTFLKKNRFNTPNFIKYKNYKQLKFFFLKNQKKIVVKPVDSSGSKGVSLVRNEKDLKKAVLMALKFSKSKSVIAEEYISNQGPQIAGDAYILNSKLAYIFLANEHFKKEGNTLVPIGESFPYIYSKKWKEKIRCEIQKLIKLIGMKFGPINLDIKIHNNKIYLMEIGPRNGGNLIPQVINHCYGINTVEMTIKSYLNEKIELKKPQKKKNYATYIINTKKNGILKKINFKKSIKDNLICQYIWKNKGDDVKKYNNSGDSIGACIFKFKSNNEMIDKMSKIEKFVNVKC